MAAPHGSEQSPTTQEARGLSPRAFRAKAPCSLPVERGSLSTDLTQPIDHVAALAHRLEQRAAVLFIARDERQLDLGLADRNVHSLAVVLDVDYVSALLRNEREQLDQLPGSVGELRPHDEIAARDRQAV